MLKCYCCADVVELADTSDLGSDAVRCAGSSPVIRINIEASVSGAFCFEKCYL